MSKMFRRFFTRARDVKKGFRNVWKPRKHLADNPPESCGRWGRIVRSILRVGIFDYFCKDNRNLNHAATGHKELFFVL